MAKRISASSASTIAEGIGSALGHMAARVDAWNSQRTVISRDLEKLIAHAQGLLSEVRQQGASVRLVRAKGKGGRPKGYKMSAATKAKLRAAWKRRKAAAKASNA